MSFLWLKLWNFIDLPGGVWLGILTAIMSYRLLHGPQLTTPEVALYASAVGCFAATNIKGPKL